MKLAEAVHGASTPEALAIVLEEIGRRYLVAKREEQKFGEAKHEIRDACVAALKRLESDVWEWAVDGQKFRAKVYPINRVKPTRALAELLAGRGLAHLVTTTVAVDDAGLFREIRRGTVSLEEVRELSEVSRSEGFRISELREKDDKERGVEE